MVNPYQDDDGKWYWYDETHDASGPYDTEAEAAAALKRHILWLDTGELEC